MENKKIVNTTVSLLAYSSTFLVLNFSLLSSFFGSPKGTVLHLSLTVPSPQAFCYKVFVCVRQHLSRQDKNPLLHV